MAFAPAGAQGTSFGFASTRIAVPGAGPTLRVANLGPCHISVAFGDDTIVVTQSTGVVVMAGHVEYFTLPVGGFVAGVAAGGPGNTSTVNLSTGAVA
jgi:hypothetical protein